MNTPTASPAGSVLVTGVSSGLGFAIAENLLANGYRVFGSVRSLEAAEPLRRVPGAERFVPLVFDVTDTAALPRVAAEVGNALGGQGLAALVNNAGIASCGPLICQASSEIRELFEVNVIAILEVTRAFLPYLRARRDGVEWPGRIVNISSVSGGVSVPFLGAYACSKHALEALTQSLRRELQIYGIGVSSIEPGLIRSRLGEKRRAANYGSRYAQSDYADILREFETTIAGQENAARGPEAVVRSVRHAIESPKPRTRYPLDLLWYLQKWLPDRVLDRLLFKSLNVQALASGSHRHASSAK